MVKKVGSTITVKLKQSTVVTVEKTVMKLILEDGDSWFTMAKYLGKLSLVIVFKVDKVPNNP